MGRRPVLLPDSVEHLPWAHSDLAILIFQGPRQDRDGPVGGDVLKNRAAARRTVSCARLVGTQEITGGEAVRITQAEGTEDYPTFAPDRSQLAYVRYGPDETAAVELLDLQTGALRRIDVPPDFYELSWSQHGELLGVVDRRREVMAIDPSDGTREVLVEVSGWDPNAQLSADGRTLYFQANASGAWADKPLPDSVPGGWLYRLRLEDSASNPEPPLPRGVPRLWGHVGAKHGVSTGNRERTGRPWRFHGRTGAAMFLLG